MAMSAHFAAKLHKPFFLVAVYTTSLGAAFRSAKVPDLQMKRLFCEVNAAGTRQSPEAIALP